jgi:thiol-disulfide isomerase/thioredoxin
MKWLDRTANIAVIVAVAVFLFIAARNDFFAPKPQPQANPEKELAGTTISLPGISFADGHDSLVLVVSTTCHFCQESLPFYKQLSEKVHGKVDLIAVIPEPETEARKFLADAGVQPEQVVKAIPGSIGVRGTPTVLFVDGKGTVKNVWKGRLDEEGQKQLLATVLPHG